MCLLDSFGGCDINARHQTAPGFDLKKTPTVTHHEELPSDMDYGKLLPLVEELRHLSVPLFGIEAGDSRATGDSRPRESGAVGCPVLTKVKPGGARVGARCRPSERGSFWATKPFGSIWASKQTAASHFLGQIRQILVATPTP